MSRRVAYLADRARIRRPVIDTNKQVVTRRNSEPEPIGDWIAARVKPVSGREFREGAMVKLAHDHEITLHHSDESGNPVLLHESDELELRVARNQKLSDVVIKQFKITGAIKETRKRTKVVSYVVQCSLETEH